MRRPLTSPYCDIASSGIHNRGLFATRDIPADVRIIEYVGEKIDKEESNRRGWEQIERAKATGEAGVYLFELNDEYDIDGNLPWNTAKLMNHSCDPNVEAQTVGGRIWFVSLKKIPKGEELTFNYGFDLENYKDHPCRCGTKRCVGYIVGEEFWPGLNRILTRTKPKSKAPAKKR